MTTLSVLVTGASTGIGFATAVLLDRRGYRVFAGVRKAQDSEKLKASNSSCLIPVLLDVAKPESVQKAFEFVKNEVGEAGLAGLVNNAGIGVASPVEFFPLDDLRTLFEVNVFGQISVTQTFLPLLRQAKGRIINIGSIGDRITVPFGGGLCASKSAFATLNDALRLELSSWGIDVCLIEPASISTPAVDKVKAGNEKRIEELSSDGSRLYASKFGKFTQRAMEREKNGSKPEVVAETIYEALTSKHPKTRYLVGKDSAILATLAHWVPDNLLDKIRLRIFGLN
jgi:NAD(P)-dependent dehydrogenase (short-subunit alcohol dehydrogenase family)